MPSLRVSSLASLGPIENHVVLLAAALAAVAVSVLALRRFMHRVPADEVERMRRMHVNGVGRYAHAEIVDVLDRSLPEGSQRVVIYHYEVAGVRYEASQDVTPMAALLSPQACMPGLPASIKYDPTNPGNSIVACESWTGLK
jgi:hypothetical protein